MSWYVEQADPQYWHAEPTEDGQGTKIWNDPPSASSPEHAQQTQSLNLLNDYLSLSSRAQESIEKGELKPGIDLVDSVAKARALDAEDLFSKADDAFEQMQRMAAVAGTAYVAARFASAEEWAEAADWARATLYRATSFRVFDDVTYRGSALTMHPLIFATYGLSGLLARQDDVANSRRALLKLAVAPLEAVQEAVAKSASVYAQSDPAFHWTLLHMFTQLCVIPREQLPDPHAPYWNEFEGNRNVELVKSAERSLLSATLGPLPAVPIPWVHVEALSNAGATAPRLLLRRAFNHLCTGFRKAARLLRSVPRSSIDTDVHAKPRSVPSATTATGGPDNEQFDESTNFELNGQRTRGAEHQYVRNPIAFRWHIAQKTILEFNIDDLIQHARSRAELLKLVRELVEMTLQEIKPPFAKSRRNWDGNTPFQWVHELFFWTGKVASRLTNEEIEAAILAPVLQADRESALLALTSFQASFLANAILPPTTMTDEAFSTWQRLSTWLIEEPTEFEGDDYLSNEQSRCLFLLLFCFSGDFAPLKCVVEQGWASMNRFEQTIAGAVAKFGTNSSVYLALLRLLKRGGLAFAPEPALSWLHQVALARRRDQAFWTSNGAETVEVLKLILTKRSDAVSQAHRATISLITDIMVDNGVRGAGFLQQDQLRR